MNKLPVLSRELIRQLDARAINEYQIPGVVLMENAGRGVAERIRTLGIEGLVLICCGQGNNGGDGFVIARHLHNWGYDVQLMCADSLEAWKGDAKIQAEIVTAMQLPILRVKLGSPKRVAKLPARVKELIADANWIVDAILGTGATGAPRSPWNAILPHVNQSSARRMAVDVPSGLDCQTGEVHDPVFQADHTCTFVAAKPGLFTSEGQRVCGVVHLVDIGAPRELIDNMLS